MLELFDKYFKAAIIKRLQQAIANTLETNEKKMTISGKKWKIYGKIKWNF